MNLEVSVMVSHVTDI